MTGAVRGTARAGRATALGLAAAMAIALVVVPPAPAGAEDRRVRIRGGGWGHGIGMSQYGAYGRATNGKNARQILQKYYTGAKVSKASMPANLRVGLLQGRKTINVSSSARAQGGGRLVFKVQGAPGRVARGGAKASWRIETSNTGGFRLFKNGTRVKSNGKSVFGSTGKPLVLKYRPHKSIVRVAEKSQNYRHGRMQFRSYSSSSCNGGFCMSLIVVLPMQHYLYGLSEVPSSWPQAALRAQAIAGRTYAFEKVKRLGQNRHPCFCAVLDSTLDQAYTGDGKRVSSGSYWSKWKKAVDATKDRVILHRGSPIQALYSSSSGGHTEHNENVWGGTAIPYLRGVNDNPDSVSANPNHKWTVTMDWSTFSSRLNARFGTGSVDRVRLVKPFGISGRVTVVRGNQGGARVVGANKTVRVSGWDMRSALGLRDSLFRITVLQPTATALSTGHSDLGGAPGEALGPEYDVPRDASQALGLAQDFEVGRMTLVHDTGRVFWHWGPVLQRYDRAGREGGNLGVPRSGMWGPGSHRGANFAGGTIVWTPDDGARVVRGPFLDAYRDLGSVGGRLGPPVSDRQGGPALPEAGKRQRFAGGTLYLAPGTREAHGLWGPVLRTYIELGEAASDCGYPTSGLTSGTATLEHGTISSSGAGPIVDCG